MYYKTRSITIPGAILSFAKGIYSENRKSKYVQANLVSNKIIAVHVISDQVFNRQIRRTPLQHIDIGSTCGTSAISVDLAASSSILALTREAFKHLSYGSRKEEIE